MPLETMWRLSWEWYADRLDPNYRPHPTDVLQAMLDGVGLSQSFWQLR